jgi:hypothetical protein
MSLTLSEFKAPVAATAVPEVEYMDGTLLYYGSTVALEQVNSRTVPAILRRTIRLTLLGQFASTVYHGDFSVRKAGHGGFLCFDAKKGVHAGADRARAPNVLVKVGAIRPRDDGYGHDDVGVHTRCGTWRT